MENYRATSLLETLDKTFAGTLMCKIEHDMNEELPASQFWFVAETNTSNALLLIRRLQDICERSGTRGLFLFLDLGKGF